MSTCNQLHLQTLGSQAVFPKNLPDRSLDPLQACVRIIIKLGHVTILGGGEGHAHAIIPSRPTATNTQSRASGIQTDLMIQLPTR